MPKMIGWREVMERIKELYELYKEAIFGYFLRMVGNKEEAGELTQEAFFQACLSLHKFKGKASLKTWFFAIARNVYLKHLREKNRVVILPLVEQALKETDSPLEILVEKEELKKFQQVLEKLPENFRTIIILREYEQFSYEEIATIFGQTVNWARVTFFRAKKQLVDTYRKLEDE
jgi:RNA polymerase sigma-70 factor (ECF subfamily)